MFTNSEASYLLNLEKVLINPNQEIDLNNKKNRLELFSYDESEYNFWMELTSNKKITLKTSVHHMESNSFIGLLRIDFKGGHHNPVAIKETLPEYLKQYANQWFQINEPHMHVFVEGYKPLAWAIPLIDTEFPIKNITDPSDVEHLIINFAKEINLNSQIKIQQAIF